MKNIPENWRDSVHSIIAAGQLVLEQRRNLTASGYREWLLLQPLSNETSMRRLATIALHPILSDPNNAHQLPAEWANLYQLSFLPDEALRSKLANGGLKGLSKHQIAQLRESYSVSAHLKQGTKEYLAAQKARGRPKLAPLKSARQELYEAKRDREGFVHAVTVLEDTCNSAVSIGIPQLSRQEIASALARVVRARYALGQLAKNLRRSSND